MQHWDRKKYRRRVSRRVGLMILATASVAFVAGKSRSKDFGKAPRLQNEVSMRVDGRELSGIRVVRDELSGNMKVALVGDRHAELHDVIVTPDLKMLSEAKIDFGPGIENRFSLCQTTAGNDCKDSLKLIKSQWEAIAVDGSGRNFLLQEYSRAIVVMNGSLTSVEHVMNFDFSTSKFTAKKRSKRYRKLEDSLSAEGFLLMKNGHVLIAKEKSPAILAEFGPAGSTPFGVSKDTLLKPGETFSITDRSGRSNLVMLAEWQIAGYGKCDISDLAADSRGSFYVLSQNCGTIQQIERLIPDEAVVVATGSWRLPKVIKNPEGLAVDQQNRFWIASDIKDKGDNLFVVSPIVQGE